MSDNISLPGTGLVVRTDEVGGGHVQIVKLSYGPDNTATVVSDSNPLPISHVGGLPTGSNKIGVVDIDEFPASSRTTDTVGATIDVVNVANGLAALPVKFAVINASSSGYTQLVAAVSTKKIRVLSYAVVVASEVTVQFASASTGITHAMPFAANGGISAHSTHGLFETAASEALRINLGSAVQVSGHLSYVEV